jgi:hypothetical protein
MRASILLILCVKFLNTRHPKMHGNKVWLCEGSPYVRVFGVLSPH